MQMSIHTLVGGGLRRISNKEYHVNESILNGCGGIEFLDINVVRQWPDKAAGLARELYVLS